MDTQNNLTEQLFVIKGRLVAVIEPTVEIWQLGSRFCAVHINTREVILEAPSASALITEINKRMQTQRTSITEYPVLVKRVAA